MASLISRQTTLASSVNFCLNRKQPLLQLQAILGSSGCMKRTMTVVFWEKNKKGSNEDPEKLPLKKRLKMYSQNLIPETRLWMKEQKEKLDTPMLAVEHGNYEVLYRFNDASSINSWTVSTDKDNQGGKSAANFTLSKNRTGLFHGYLCKDVPKDGKTKYAGYANVSAPTPKRSFNRDTRMDWSLFNSLLLRVRGDGRAYMIVAGCDFYFDLNWLNRWTCPLYTRGGPYWQNVKIPLSKFYVSHSGRIQDKQEHMPLEIVNSFGITAGDSAEGPFSLEIDSVALMYDTTLSGVHAYEMYENKYWEVQT